MALAKDGIVKKVNDTSTGGPTMFQPEIRELRKGLRQDIVERIVEAKMGQQARRVMGLLLHHPLLESKTVWDLAMLPKKDANEVRGRRFLLLQSVYARCMHVCVSFSGSRFEATYTLHFLETARSHTSKCQWLALLCARV